MENLILRFPMIALQSPYGQRTVFNHEEYSGKCVKPAAEKGACDMTATQNKSSRTPATNDCSSLNRTETGYHSWSPGGNHCCYKSTEKCEYFSLDSIEKCDFSSPNSPGKCDFSSPNSPEKHDYLSLNSREKYDIASPDSTEKYVNTGLYITETEDSCSMNMTSKGDYFSPCMKSIHDTASVQESEVKRHHCCTLSSNKDDLTLSGTQHVDHRSVNLY